jgi:hypothetical protein
MPSQFEKHTSKPNSRPPAEGKITVKYNSVPRQIIMKYPGELGPEKTF